jgi:hemin uptake protein HemP
MRTIIIKNVHRLELAMFDSNTTPHAVMNPPGDIASSASVPPPRATRISSGNLLAGRRELVIEHAGQEYVLRLTRNDKLILTK